MRGVVDVNEPRSLERKLIRHIQKKGFLITANGSLNMAVLMPGKIVISTSKNEDKILVTRKQIRRALRLMQIHRTLVRKDLEKISPFSSALFGILIQVYAGKSKLHKLKNGLFRLSLLGVRFFAGGLERDKTILGEYQKLGGKFLLYNYFQLLQSSSSWLQHLYENDLYCIIDSGSYSIFQEKQKRKKRAFPQQQLLNEETLTDQYIEGYASFIEANKDEKRILGFFPFDCIGDPVQTKMNYERLIKLSNAKIYPVWQITDSLDELQRLIDEEPEMIGIGGIVPFLGNRLDQVKIMLRKVFDCFPTVNFHLLGVANEFLLEFPCFSSDSTAFINARKSKKQRKIYLQDGTRIGAPTHMSTLEIIKQNLSYLISLEDLEQNQQLKLSL
ncbi:hypothetical protein B14911_10847 [Bacillus sp. NRRL B-14911]|nr:hypothetical protein B14911_10847 [Bacillus sp. NRRL B-14911]